MFSKAFSNPSKAYWSIQAAGLIWILGAFALLKFYGLETTQALVDAAIFGGMFQLGVTLLDRIFSFYMPKSGSVWLLLILPLIFGAAGVMIHFFVLEMLFEDNTSYRDFLKKGLPVRFTMYWVSLTLVTLIAIVVSKLEQQEKIQEREIMMQELSKEAELTQLRQQLQPHFLFNSLNSINALVVSQPERAREMVQQLADFLRGTIRKDHQKWLTIEEELSYLKLYLDIEKVRFGHRLQVDFEMEDLVKSMKIPQLLIQPLLENSIKHGLYGTTEDVRILLRASRQNNYLQVEIENPFDPEHASPKGAGFGLSSVERRLFLLFGRKDLLITGAKGALFRVSIKIPQLK